MPPKLPETARAPGRIYYLLGPVVLLLGGAMLGYYIYFGFTRFDYRVEQTFPVRVLAPGSYEIELEREGDYSIYYEYESELQGKQYFSRIEDRNFDISLTSKAPPKKIEIDRPFGSVKYMLPGRKGVAIGAFKITEPGIYTFSVSQADDTKGARAVIAIGSGMFGFIGETILMVLGGLAIFVATFALAAIIMVAVYIKRSRRNNIKVDRPSGAPRDGPRPVHPK
ncbi:hypothetical protein MNBD_NITROSPINAE02-2019 [hydrothermal vent metagenome]|uniref:Uncharacterized protein n=1 Tax=hydrothermal vent metagenome TaxID=652676 RepID=A0A3B1D7E6_9ZZZZ